MAKTDKPDGMVHVTTSDGETGWVSPQTARHMMQRDPRTKAADGKPAERQAKTEQAKKPAATNTDRK